MHVLKEILCGLQEVSHQNLGPGAMNILRALRIVLWLNLRKLGGEALLIQVLCIGVALMAGQLIRYPYCSKAIVFAVGELAFGLDRALVQTMFVRGVDHVASGTF